MLRHRLLHKECLNAYALRLADLQIRLNPLREELVIIFNELERDHYQEAICREGSRVKKLGLVRRSNDLHYVQQLEGDLLEDVDSQPWLVTISVSGLVRIPRQEDYILISGELYVISLVSPLNRDLDSLIVISCYPCRTVRDVLKCVSVSLLEDGSLDIVYGGCPKSYSFEELSIDDEGLRREFVSVISAGSFPLRGTLYLFGDCGDYCEYSYDLLLGG